MKAPNRQREVQLKFRVTPEERALIEKKMEQLGTTNMASYMGEAAKTLDYARRRQKVIFQLIEGIMLLDKKREQKTL